jgi:hypothetical protein
MKSVRDNVDDLLLFYGAMVVIHREKYCNEVKKRDGNRREGGGRTEREREKERKT